MFRATFMLWRTFSCAQPCSFPLFHHAPVKNECDYNLKSRLNKLNLFQVDCLLFFKLIIIHVNSNDCVIFGRREKSQEEEVWYKGRVGNSLVSEKVLLPVLPALPCCEPSYPGASGPHPRTFAWAHALLHYHLRTCFPINGSLTPH